MNSKLTTALTLSILYFAAMPIFAGEPEHFKVGSLAHTTVQTLIYDSENTWADETAGDMHKGQEGTHPHIKQCQVGAKVKILAESNLVDTSRSA